MSRLSNLLLGSLALLGVASCSVEAPDRTIQGAAALAPAHDEPCAAGSACVAALGEGPGAAAPAASTPRLLEFEAAYCAACATMAPVVTSIVKSCAKASEDVQRVDVGEEGGEALARHYRVGSLPTFLAVDAEGHEVFRKVGVQQPSELAGLVAQVTGRDCSTVN